jgi:membrane-associated phospholipid phosphatase
MNHAGLLSRVFHPLLVLPVSALLFLKLSGLGLFDSVYWLFLWILISLAPTTVTTYFTGEKGLNVPEREKRWKPFVVGVSSLALSLVPFWILSAPTVVLKLGVTGVVAITVFGVANHFNKVSVHTGSVACAAAIFTIVSSHAAAFLALSSVLVGWSRVELERHSLVQVVQGGVLGVLCGLVFLAL